MFVVFTYLLQLQNNSNLLYEIKIIEKCLKLEMDALYTILQIGNIRF